MGALDVSVFSEKARRDLLSLLDRVPGKKNIVLQRSLVGQIELLVKHSTLQDHGVDRIFFLENDNLNSSQRNVIFLVRGEKPQQIQAVADQIKRLRAESQIDHDLTVTWVPRKTLLSDTILEEAGVLGDVKTTEFDLYFQPLDKDLLSLELEDAFSDLYLRRDPTSIYTSAQALMTLQNRCGLFPRLLAKGDFATRLVELLQRMRLEQAVEHGMRHKTVPSKSEMPSSDLDTIIVIDRQSDLASPLLTQLTYEGLIDETFKIDHGQTELDSSIAGMPAQSARPKEPTAGASQNNMKQKVKLDGNDKLYASLRDANFAIVGSILNRVARRLQNDYEERRGDKSTAELKAFVSKLPGYQAEHESLKIHTGLAEELHKRTRADMFRRALEVQQNLVAGTDASAMHDIVEDLIARDCPLQAVLRLLCLESVISGGLRQRDLEHFRRAVVQAYGYQHLLTLDALNKMGLLTQRASSGFAIPGAATVGVGVNAVASSVAAQTNYAAIRKTLGLFVDDVSEQSPADIAYVFSGYAPLSVRIVQCVLQKQYVFGLARSAAAALNPANLASVGNGAAASASQGWRGFESLLSNVKGKTTDEVQTSANKSSRAKQVLEGRGGKKTSIVFFLGGITFAEIAALRFIAQQEEQTRDLLICTTSIISGGKMVDAAIATSNVTKG